ncbi:MAG: hypothetical protein AAF465_02745 [Pseudomonadota bacterium]
MFTTREIFLFIALAALALSDLAVWTKVNDYTRKPVEEALTSPSAIARSASMPTVNCVAPVMHIDL